MKKILFAFLVVTMMTFAAKATNANAPSMEKKFFNAKSLTYPSGSGEFIDGCGNTVTFSWSCNFDCSGGQIAGAISSFISGYGCGNYDEQGYYY